ncbi:MAG: hypothetical protein JSS87_12760 [Acidobacteria bacterium]|nr:hypothetical protein [Acidobacteriota bacterium]
MEPFLPHLGRVLMVLGLSIGCVAHGCVAQHLSLNGEAAYGSKLPFSYANTVHKNVYNAAEWCDKQGQLDDSCLRNALAKARLKTPSRVLLPRGLYIFGNNVTVTGLANIEIAGTGASTIIQRDGTAFQCYSCTDITLHDIAFTSATIPIKKLISELPTADPNQIIVIDRFNSGWGYIPTVNDTDLIVANGCSKHCLSATQLAASFDNGVYFRGGSNIEIFGLRGKFYSISADSVTAISIHNNVGRNGGKSNKGGCVTVGSGSERVRVSDNNFSYCSNAGYVYRGANTVIHTRNIAMYNGESGHKIGQNASLHVTHFTSSSNISAYNWFDGYDYSEDYPHTGTTVCHCTSHDDVAYSNRGVGFYLDGAYWSISAALVHDNAKDGINAALSHSSITDSVIYGNNTLRRRGTHQVTIQPGDGVSFVNNTISDNGNGEYGVYAVNPINQIYRGNTVKGAQTWNGHSGTAISPF